ncbi:MAG: ROK family protein [Candidatus Omnitrophica bacterium]|nr:ROK family protein [Candidatus Omnitrophota bacterium]
MTQKIFVGIDVGGTKIATGLVSPSGKILSRAKSPTPPNASSAEIIRSISFLCDEMFSNCNLKKKNLAGLGIGIPGIVDDKGVVIRTPNMSLSKVNLKKQLEQKFKVKVALGNDANFGVLGEKWLGAARKVHNVVGLFLGTGLGAGVVINDRIFTGSHGAAAELGHMILQDRGGPKCGCGNQGCLEALTGRWAMERDIKKAIAEGKKTIVTKLVDNIHKPIKSRILYESLERHDPLVSKIVTEASYQLGIACISVKHIFDPEMIVLGGGVMKACGDFILPIVKKVAQKDKFFLGIGSCEIVASELEDDAIILGAVAALAGSR